MQKSDWFYFSIVAFYIAYIKFYYYNKNIICLPRELGDVLSPIRVFMEEVILMSTYEEFMVILTAGIFLVSIPEHV